MLINVDRQRPHLAAAMLLVSICLLPQTASAQEDWDFTPDDLDTLTASGGDLTFGPDSGWFPDSLKDNLKKTIKKVLKPDPNNPNAPSSDGVNVRDFYHGHVACPAPCSKAVDEARKEFSRIEREIMGAAMGGEGFTLTKENLGVFRQALQKVEAAARTLLDACWKDGCVVIYHTYETNSPDGMGTDDPRRNVLTPKDGEPGTYRPPNPNNASVWYQDYCLCLQFSFLVRENGRIHVTLGSTQELSRVTGKPMQ